jgi:hypothetical protein
MKKNQSCHKEKVLPITAALAVGAAVPETVHEFDPNW